MRNIINIAGIMDFERLSLASMAQSRKSIAGANLTARLIKIGGPKVDHSTYSGMAPKPCCDLDSQDQGYRADTIGQVLVTTNVIAFSCQTDKYDTSSYW